MQIIDTHCHLYGNSFLSDIDAVIARAETEGVEKFYLPAIDSETHQAMIDLETRFPGKCIAMMGLHPCSVQEDYQKELAIVEEWLAKRPFTAVGEIGLDYYWDRSWDAQQAEAFHRQIELALHYKLPIVIHSRESMEECIAIVREHQKGALGGIFHCFTGTADQAQRIIDAGLYLGIGGVLTYKKSPLPEALAGIPLEAMVLETDAPYLPPVPFRGKRNESSYLKYIIEKLAEVKGVSKEEVAKITTANAQKIFG
ncbi:TatD family hydrolase [Paraflavitalea sp. CAU 1676]|uniref:TatD family hydrolase n=1 Tax=Paraflavitalea sp. CAU 1676 TaxID=3032598 RepID=UPI0023D9F725|nr:TatD family hydrolase [Paraflavitalea sp. CAU 1676]MDF2187308.1 TatD family hydrolase [Paraflavitalea sp. CAU 1676]